MRTELIQDVPESDWPPELAGLKAKKLRGGRRVITNRQLAQLLGCTPDNLRKMCRAGKLKRETDLDESTVTWYRLEEAARVYLARRPDRIPEPDYEADIPFLARRREREEQERQDAERTAGAHLGALVPIGASALAATHLDIQALPALSPETLTALLVQQAQTQRKMGELIQELVEQRNAGAEREEVISDLNDTIRDMNDKLLARTERNAELVERNADLTISLARSGDLVSELRAQLQAVREQAQAEKQTPKSEADQPPAPRVPRRRGLGQR